MNELCFSPYTIIVFLAHPSWVSSLCRLTLAMRASVNPDSFFAWLNAFSSTCAIEAPIYFAWGRGRALRTLPGQVLLLNLATHPLVFWGPSRLFHAYAGPEWAATLSGEVFAPTVEALLLYALYRYPAKVAGAAAITANLASWWIGAYLNDFNL